MRRALTQEAEDTQAAEETPTAAETDVTPQPSSGEGSDEPSFLDVISSEAASTSENPEEPDAPNPEAEAETQDATAEGEEATSEDPDQDTSDSSEGDASEEPGDDPEALTPEERKGMSRRAAQRIEQLLAERKGLREQASQAEPIVNFMREHDIAMQDVDVILGLSAQLRKGDFAGFLRSVTPYVSLARQYVGEVLPQDLQEQVNKGLVAEPVARELAQRRAQEHVGQQEAQRQQARSEQEVRALRGQAIRSAVTNWETQIKASDPDYGAKQDVVQRYAKALMHEQGAPETPEQAIEYVKQAYEQANKDVARFRPAPKPTAQTPSSVHQAAKTPKPEPENFLDVVRMNLGA